MSFDFARQSFVAIVSAVTNFVTGFILIQSCLIVWTAVLFPLTVQRSRLSIERYPAYTLCIGFAGLLGLAVLTSGLLLLRMPCIDMVSQLLSALFNFLSVNRFSNDAYMIVHGIGWMLLGPFFWAWTVGEAAVAEIFSRRMQQRGLARSSTTGLIGGALCTSAPAFLPVIGWFCFLPLVTLMSLGAGICSYLPTRVRDAYVAEQPEGRLDVNSSKATRDVTLG